MEWPGWLTSAWSKASPYAERLAIWRGYEDALQSLLIYAIGIAVYTILVFTFYQNLSKRSAFTIKPRPGFWGALVSRAEATLVFPLMSFLYFGVLALSLFVLAKSQTTYQIMLLSMSVVVGVRVTAFLSENASLDLAKMLPLALLGVLVVDPSYMSLELTWARLMETPEMLPILWRFFVFFIVLEGVFRLARAAIHRVTGRASKPKPAKTKKADLIPVK